jgi:hypothetical protein
MELYKAEECTVFMHYAEPGLPEQKDAEKISLDSEGKIELETLLEELAEIIESENGILTP